MLDGKNFIGYGRSKRGTVTFQTVNPVLNVENPSVFYEASSEEVAEATQLAYQAFPFFSETSNEHRAVFLNAIAEEIMTLDKALIDIYCNETGLPEGRAIGERGRTVNQLRSFAAFLEGGSWMEATIDLPEPDRKPVPKPDLRKMMMPLGPVVVFGASNFPLAYSAAGGDTASALAAGCPVIVKGHPMHAGTGSMVASAIIKAAQKTKMPDGVYSYLNSSSIAVGTLLVKDKRVKAVGFTGSLQGGRALFDLAAQREEPIPVFAEMGSINPVLLLPEALKVDDGEWAKTIAQSVTLGSGQFCTNPGLLLAIKNPDLERFSETLSEEIKAITPSSMLHPHIARKYEDGKSHMEAQPGISKIAEYRDSVPENFARPTILRVSSADFKENPNLHKEVFGPYSLLVECTGIEDLEQVVAKIEGQLTASLIGTNQELNGYDRVIRMLRDRVGRLIFNGVPTGVEVCAAMQHGGPYPATTDSRFTAVGVDAIKRWLRPVSFQNCPDTLLPMALRNANPLKLERRIDGVWTKANIA
jgi:NADP-dependent aldehyde dehydrogenase